MHMLYRVKLLIYPLLSRTHIKINDSLRKIMPFVGVRGPRRPEREAQRSQQATRLIRK